MIDKHEIISKSEQFGIKTADVERDYVFGWLLAGIYSASPLKDIFILKGGNGLRKAYFANTRFSVDLDFATQTSVNESFLIAELNRVCEFVHASTGIEFETDRSRIQEKSLSDRDQSRKIYEARLYFKDFYGNPNSITISVRLDITEFDRLYLPIQERHLIHPYTDAATCTATVRCLKLEEMLAAKLKCLLQRRYSFDLYDYVYSVFINREIEVNRAEIVSTFLKKTIFEPNPAVVPGLLLGLPFQVLKGAWSQYIVAPVQSLIAFDQAVAWFTESIQDLFGRFAAGIGRFAYFPAELRNPIIDAGSRLALVSITYDGIPRTVEPYSLAFKRRQDGVGQEYLYVYDRTGGRGSGPGLKSFISAKISAIEPLEDTFEPRFPVELSKAGEYGSKTYFGKPFGFPRAATGRRSSGMFGIRRSGIVYVVECSYCNKQFRRLKFSTRLNEHKDRYGNRCFGRVGHLVDRRYM